MNLFLLIASLFAAITWMIHVIAGGREVVAPLLDSDIAWVPRITHYYCWHMVTITLAVMALGFAYGGFFEQGLDVAWLVEILAILFALWNVALGLWKRPKPWYALPQWVLFLAISVVALPGLL